MAASTVSRPCLTCASSARLASLGSTNMAGVAVSGCSLVGTGDDESASDPAEGGGEADGTVVLVTHDSFFLPEELVKSFERESGYDLEQRAGGDAGALTSQLVLNTDSPIGDVAFGVDNTFGSRALEADVFEPVDIDAPAGVEENALPGDDEIIITCAVCGAQCYPALGCCQTQGALKTKAGKGGGPPAKGGSGSDRFDPRNNSTYQKGAANDNRGRGGGRGGNRSSPGFLGPVVPLEKRDDAWTPQHASSGALEEAQKEN